MPNINTMDLFIETGICGVPGTVFGDKERNNTVRFALGIEPLARNQ